ncbi:MAG: hypothetical protein M1405_02785 [Patescibacteria group bacterium]|nr:hypothetical protein [Patescibacteria group bacterium]
MIKSKNYQINSFRHLNIHLSFAYLLICLLVGLFAYLLIFAPAAQAQVSLGVFPPILQIQATPPTDIKSKILIENLGNDPVDLRIGIKPFTASDSENGQVTYLSDFSYVDPFIFDKMQILDQDTSIDSITLSPGQKKELMLEIALPQGEPLGDYYFSIVFISSNQPAKTANVSGQAAGIATNVLLSVGPKGMTQGNIEEFSAPLFVPSGPVPFTVRVRNTSDHFITTKGNILIKNMFGQTVGNVDLLPVNILSQSVRSIPDSLQSPTATTPASFKSYVLSLKSPAAVWPETFLFGPYTATLTIALSDQGPLYRRTVSFYAFPTETLFGILIIILIITAIIIRVKKTANKV